MAYDDLLKQVQGRRFELKMFAVFFFNGIPNALLIVSLVLIFYMPKNYRCEFPEEVADFVEKNSSALNATLNYFIPYEKDGERSKCLRYNRSSEDIESFLQNAIHGDLQDSIENTTTISCENDHFFDNPLRIHSIAMELDWSCDNDWLKPIVSMAYILGLTIASLGGFISDRYGRRPIFNLFTFLLFLTIFLQSFCTSTWTYAVSLFFSGIVGMVNYTAGFVLGTECTIPEKRNFLSISSFVSFSFGYGIATFIFYLVSDWRWHLRVCGLLGLLFLPNLWLVPESPRWLMANGRTKEAKKVLTMIAEANNKSKDVTKKVLEEAEKVAHSLMDENGETRSEVMTNKKLLKETFKSSRMRRTAFVAAFSWFSIALVYYGITLSVQALSGNIFVNNTVMGLIEIPGYLLAYAAVKYLSRPKTHSGFMIASGVFCMGAALISQVNQEIASVAGLVGKSLNAGAFYVVYIHTAEVFPTLARNSCMSIGSFAGRLGSIVSPYFSYMVDLYGIYAPYITMSMITIASGVLTLLFFPETRNVELPDTVAESVRLKTIFSSCGNEKKKRNEDRYKDGCSENMMPNTDKNEAFDLPRLNC